MTKKLRKTILQEADLRNVRGMAREYFKKSKIDFSMLRMSDFEKLKDLIQIEIDNGVKDPSKEIIPKLKVKNIKRATHGIPLRISGYYFKDREGITFNTNPLFIGFCGELVGDNQAPFIVGFVNWVDHLKEKNNV